jgi:hypothetical protein
MVVFGIVSNNDYASGASRTDLAEVLKEGVECHGVEPFLLSSEKQFPVAQPDSAKVTHAFSCWMMQQHRVFLLRGYPHPATRPILLEMDLIGRPEIDSLIGDELS